MLLHLYLTMACIGGIEIIVRSGLLSSINAIVETTKKVSHVIMAANISDHWKEKMVPTYAFFIFKNSLRIFAVLIAVIMVFFCFSLLSDNLITYTLSVKCVLESVVIAYVYVKAKDRLLSE